MENRPKLNIDRNMKTVKHWQRHENRKYDLFFNFLIHARAGIFCKLGSGTKPFDS